MLSQKPFRICLIMPEKYPHSLCFREIGLLLLSTLKTNGFECDFKFNELSRYRINIILGYHLLTFSDNLKKYNYIPYQLEQLHSLEYPFSKNMELILRHAVTVWDYSKENIIFLKNIGIHAQLLLPGYHKSLELISKSADQPIDILFYGSLGDRRRAVLTELAKQFEVKSLFGVYGDKRDEWISRSKIILNIHHYSTQIFESVRISYLLNNCCFIISEDSKYYSYEEVDLPLVPFDQIIEQCNYYLKNQKHITLKRKENYLSFKKNYPMKNLLKGVLEYE